MKKLCLLWLFLSMAILTHAQSALFISGTSINNNTICTDTMGQFMVEYNSTGTTFTANNVFKLWLSDQSGSFSNATVIGQTFSTQTSGVIYAYVPMGVSPGTGYRIKVTSSTPALTSNDNGVDLTIAASPQVVISNNSPVCAGQSVMLAATGDPTWTYVWFHNGAIVSTQPTHFIPSVSQNDVGVYGLMVTNTAGCTFNTYTVVDINGTFIPVSTNGPICLGNSVTFTANGNFTTYNWTTPNGVAMTGQTITIPNFQLTDEGMYYVTGSGGSSGCGGAGSIFAQAGPVLAPFSNSPVCPGGTIFLYADSSFQSNNTYSWIGPNGFSSTQQNPIIQNATVANAGTYTVYASNGSCTAGPATVQVSVSATTPTVTAYSNSPVLQGGTLVLDAAGPWGNYIWTGPNNFFYQGQSAFLPNVTPANAGLYTVTVTVPGCGSATATVLVQVDGQNSISGVIYDDQNNNGVMDSGEQPLSGVAVVALPGNYIAYSDTFGMYTVYVPVGSYTVSVLGLQSGQTSNPTNYMVTLTSTGQNATGNDFGIHSVPAQDLMVSIAENWTAAPGFTTFQVVSCHNTGTIPMSGSLRYKPDAALVLQSSTSGGYTLSADTLVWNFTNLQPGGSIYKYVYATVPATTPLGTILVSGAKVTPVSGDVTPGNNMFTLNQTVTGSWDPNDKLVQPAGGITPSQIAAGQDLVYTVRFQNTGTAPAVNIQILDTLSQNLDITTFEMLSASHAYELEMKTPGVLDWKFNNIMLPDSNSNEPASHGYVQYRIKPMADLQVGHQIENTAYIYFDFNAAVVTNTTVTTVGLLATPDDALTANLSVFPNPNTGNFTVQLADCKAGKVTVRVLNVLGQQVYSEAASTQNNALEHKLSVKDMPNGMYLVQVQQGDQVTTTRMIVQK